MSKQTATPQTIVLAAFKQHGQLTTDIVKRLGVSNLPDVIADLESQGYGIERKRTKNKSALAKAKGLGKSVVYTLESLPEQ